MTETEVAKMTVEEVEAVVAAEWRKRGIYKENDEKFLKAFKAMIKAKRTAVKAKQARARRDDRYLVNDNVSETKV